MKKLKLTIGQRFMMQYIVKGGGSLPLSLIRIGDNILTKVLISKRELEGVDYKVDEKTKAATWKELGSEVEFEFTGDEMKMMIECLKRMEENDKQEFSMPEGQMLLELINKIGGINGK